MAGGGMNVLGGGNPFSMYSPRGPVSPFRGNVVPQQMRVQGGPYSLTNPVNQPPTVNVAPQQMRVPAWSSPAPYTMAGFSGMPQNAQAVPPLVNPFSFNSPAPAQPVNLRPDQMALAPEVMQVAPEPVGGLRAMSGGGIARFADGGTTQQQYFAGGDPSLAGPELPYPRTAQEAYDQVIQGYMRPEYRAYRDSFYPSTRAYLLDPDAPDFMQSVRYFAEQAMQNWISFNGQNPWTAPPTQPPPPPSKEPTDKPPPGTKEPPPPDTGSPLPTIPTMPPPISLGPTKPIVTGEGTPVKKPGLTTTDAPPPTKEPTDKPPPGTKEPPPPDTGTKAPQVPTIPPTYKPFPTSTRGTFAPWATPSALPVAKPGFTSAPTGTGMVTSPPITVGTLPSFAELAKQYPYTGLTTFGQPPVIPYGLPFVPPGATIPPNYFTPAPELSLPTFSLPPLLRQATPFNPPAPPAPTAPRIAEDPSDVFFPDPYQSLSLQDSSMFMQQLAALQKEMDALKASGAAPAPAPAGDSTPAAARKGGIVSLLKKKQVKKRKK